MENVDDGFLIEIREHMFAAWNLKSLFSYFKINASMKLVFVLELLIFLKTSFLSAIFQVISDVLFWNLTIHVGIVLEP